MTSYCIQNTYSGEGACSPSEGVCAGAEADAVAPKLTAAPEQLLVLLGLERDC